MLLFYLNLEIDWIQEFAAKKEQEQKMEKVKVIIMLQVIVYRRKKSIFS